MCFCFPFHCFNMPSCTEPQVCKIKIALDPPLPMPQVYCYFIQAHCSAAFKKSLHFISEFISTTTAEGRGHWYFSSKKHAQNKELNCKLTFWDMPTAHLALLKLFVTGKRSNSPGLVLHLLYAFTLYHSVSLGSCCLPFCIFIYRRNFTRLGFGVLGFFFGGCQTEETWVYSQDTGKEKKNARD